MNLETANIRMALHFSKEIKLIAAKKNSISTISTYVHYRIKDSILVWRQFLLHDIIRRLEN